MVSCTLTNSGGCYDGSAESGGMLLPDCSRDRLALVVLAQCFPHTVNITYRGPQRLCEHLCGVGCNNAAMLAPRRALQAGRLKLGEETHGTPRNLSASSALSATRPCEATKSSRHSQPLCLPPPSPSDHLLVTEHARRSLDHIERRTSLLATR